MKIWKDKLIKLFFLLFLILLFSASATSTCNEVFSKLKDKSIEDLVRILQADSRGTKERKDVKEYLNKAYEHLRAIPVYKELEIGIYYMEKVRESIDRKYAPEYYRLAYDYFDRAIEADKTSPLRKNKSIEDLVRILLADSRDTKEWKDVKEYLNEAYEHLRDIPGYKELNQGIYYMEGIKEFKHRKNNTRDYYGLAYDYFDRAIEADKTSPLRKDKSIEDLVRILQADSRGTKEWKDVKEYLNKAYEHLRAIPGYEELEIGIYYMEKAREFKHRKNNTREYYGLAHYHFKQAIEADKTSPLRKNKSIEDLVRILLADSRDTKEWKDVKEYLNEAYEHLRALPGYKELNQGIYYMEGIKEFKHRKNNTRDYYGLAHYHFDRAIDKSAQSNMDFGYLIRILQEDSRDTKEWKDVKEYLNTSYDHLGYIPGYKALNQGMNYMEKAREFKHRKNNIREYYRLAHYHFDRAIEADKTSPLRKDKSIEDLIRILQEDSRDTKEWKDVKEYLNTSYDHLGYIPGYKALNQGMNYMEKARESIDRKYAPEYYRLAHYHFDRAIEADKTSPLRKDKSIEDLVRILQEDSRDTIEWKDVKEYLNTSYEYLRAIPGYKALNQGMNYLEKAKEFEKGKNARHYYRLAYDYFDRAIEVYTTSPLRKDESAQSNMDFGYLIRVLREDSQDTKKWKDPQKYLNEDYKYLRDIPGYKALHQGMNYLEKAKEFEKGKNARHYYRLAHYHFKQFIKADKASPLGYIQLAKMYMKGEDVPVNLNMARRLLMPFNKPNALLGNQVARQLIKEIDEINEIEKKKN